MGTVGAAPAIEVPRQSSWKKWFWRSFGFGAGLAVALVTIVGGFIWYSDRPVRPKPWDTKSITAKYRNVNNGGEKIRFNYILVNKTDEDFRLSEGSGSDVGVRIDSSDVYNFSSLKVDFPILVPAHQQALLTLTLEDSRHPKPQAGDDDEERDKNRTAIEQYLAKQFGALNGFVLLDESGRRRIEFPPGWKPSK